MVITAQDTKLKPGYKRTEVGEIPEDWNVRSLGQIGDFKNGINKGKTDFGHGFPFVNLLDVFGVIKVFNDSGFGLVNSTDTDRKVYGLKKGNILFVRSSVKPEGVGLTTLVAEDLQDTVYSGFLIRFRDKGELAFEFKEHCFRQFGFRNRLIANSTVSANTNINQNALKNLQIVFPPSKEEQQAIATALSDVDALIASLDQLIAKKRDIKQATMQQLLTGKRRLPGFSGEWEVKKLKEECELITKGTTPTSLGKNFSTHGVNFIKIESLTDEGRIIWDKLAFIDEETHNLLRRSQLKNKDILFSIAGALGRTTLVKQDILPANTNQALALIRLKDQSCLGYIFLTKYLTSPEIIRHIGSINVQAAQANLSLEDIRNFEIRIPAIPEQQAIATVLSDMDAEITALEQRRDKTRALKQGMMQELLAGKTRLL